MTRRELLERLALAPLAIGVLALQTGAEAAKKKGGANGAGGGAISGVVDDVLVAPDSVLIDFQYGTALAVEFFRNNEEQAVVINKKTKIYVNGERQNFRELLAEAYARPWNVSRIFRGSRMTARMRTVIIASRIDFEYT